MADSIARVAAATTGTQGTTAADTTPATASTDFLASQRIDFLKLLVAQMKYQTPDKPMDPTEFMSQTAQFTQVETLNNLLAVTRENSSWQRILGQASLIGKQVSGTVDGKTVAGTVTGISSTADGSFALLKGGTKIPLTAITTITQPA